MGLRTKCEMRGDRHLEKQFVFLWACVCAHAPVCACVFVLCAEFNETWGGGVEKGNWKTSCVFNQIEWIGMIVLHFKYEISCNLCGHVCACFQMSLYECMWVPILLSVCIPVWLGSFECVQSGHLLLSEK